MAWALVILAGVFEAAFAVTLKLSHGFTQLVPTLLFCVFALASFGLLTVALKHLEVGTAYAVWTGLGAAGAVSVGMLWLDETVSVLKIVSVGLVLVGVIGLQLAGGAH